MKYLFLLFLITADKGCDSAKSETFVLLKATSQRWVGGAAGSGSGTYYTVYLGMKHDTSYVFDSLWVNNHRIPVEVKRERSLNDTLVLYANDFVRMKPNPSGEGVIRIGEEDAAPPVAGVEGVLGYFHGAEREYLVIPQWTKLKQLNFQ